MEKNIRIVLQYDGTRYDGWQKQGNTDKTIQGKLEGILGKLAGIPIEAHGSGRTDAGVHALAQTANFNLPWEECARVLTAGKEEPLEALKRYINSYLPEDIAVLEIGEAAPRFHSRLNAVSKTYQYRIETAPKADVFERRYVYCLGKELNLEAMRRASVFLCGTHDFKAFCSARRSKKSTVRTLSRIDVRKEGSKVILTFTGDGFLYNMVRILTGTLIEAGLLERTAESVKDALEGRERAAAGRTAPAQGLFLAEVAY